MVNQLLADARRQNVLVNGQRLEVFLLTPSLPLLLGDTLLCRVLAPSADACGEPLFTDTRTLGGPTNSSAAAPEPGTQEVQGSSVRQGPATIQLGLPREGGSPVLIRRDAGLDGFPRFAYLREFVEESTRGFAGSYYTCQMQTPEGQLEDTCTTSDARYGSLRNGNLRARWLWHVPRNSVAQVLLSVAERLAVLNASGEVHGDVKPSNVMVTAQGVQVFDSLCLQAGVRAPAMTRGFAAPEQVLGRTVTGQTDQYALGMMLVNLVGGVPHGEETRVTIPAGGTRLDYHTLLRNPGVFIDPITAPVAPDAVASWRDFIEQCIRFDPESRHPSPALLVTALREIVARNALLGNVVVPISFGRPVLAEDEAGSPVAAWVASGHAMSGATGNFGVWPSTVERPRP